MKDSLSARSIAARHARWEERLPASDRELWDALGLLDGDDQASLFAHCAAYGVNALWEPVSRYDGRVSAHGVERRLQHSHVLAHAVGLDMAAAGWRPTVDTYLGRVTKARILQAVGDARGGPAATQIDHLKKIDMAQAAERLLEGSGWLAEPLRTPEPLLVAQSDAIGADRPVDEAAPIGENPDGDQAPFAIAAE